MSEERALYWYDDATYDIGFYNYYQRTIDPSPWAFIVCLMFCVVLALLLPRYVSYYRTIYSSDETKKRNLSNTEDSNSSIVLGSQEFIASDDDLHNNRESNRSKQEPRLPPIAERTLPNQSVEDSEELKVNHKGRIKRQRAFLSRATHSFGHHEQNNENSVVIEENELGQSTDYANMTDGDGSHRLCEDVAVVDAKISTMLSSKQNYMSDGTNEDNCNAEPKDVAKRSQSYISSASSTSTSNPWQIIKSDLEDFSKIRDPIDILSVASSWEEEFEQAAQATVYVHQKTGKKTTNKPVERVPDDRRPWYLFYCSPAFRRKIRKCRRWDDEMEKIIGLALPYTAHTIVVDVFKLLEVGIIGRTLGTSDLSAYFATEFAISFATMFFFGILASLKVLVSQAHGAKNIKLAGTYVHIGIWTHHLFSLPLILYGWNNFDDIVLRLGLDEETAESAEQYARFVFIYEAIGIYDGALHCVLDVTGHERYSAISNGVRAFISFLAVLIVSKVDENAKLWMVGAIHVAIKVLFIIISGCYICYKQWLVDYWNEMSKNPFEDWRTVKILWKASLRLSSGRVIENCEWNILFVFAAIQGPAEVAIWGLVGELWDFADDIVVAVSDASKVRCAHLLGSGLPEQAKYSAEKSLLMGVAISIFMSLSLGIFQSVIPMW
eukprot:CAMPEP_0197178516 /NCGR_PEP_ID=MMETSP1423-20130617/3770_1 /TAXON_ID=476441 /ORGANISM="Pseudo-nitzschia heimii, Strain UNC1101" /LENGTH=663 /DNA_ID=CAMNT_0042628277 /DNA_START=128 /DNA_END=2116 /DNA_ORIENTATION=+